MLVALSPAKKLDWTEAPVPAQGAPVFQDQAAELAELARRLSVQELRGLMHISENLARLNRDRFAAFAPAPAPEATRPAAFAFAGDTYTGLEARTLDTDALRWAQDHLRILSGLYGLLRPLDPIQPHRLEMGSRLASPRGKSLYDWWGTQIAGALDQSAAQVGAQVLVNCASVEYFSAVDRTALKTPVITPVFMEECGGQARIVSFYAKKARGAMARFIVENRLTDPAALTEFDSGGYRFMPEMSDPDRPVFLREG